MRYPLVDGQGNFGSIDDDPPAAMRYTEARPGAGRRSDDDGSRQGDRRLRSQLRRDDRRTDRPADDLPEPARQRFVRHRRRHGDQHPAAQHARGDRRRHRGDREPHREPRNPASDPLQGRSRSRLPDRRLHRRPRRDLPGLHPGSRRHHDARQGHGRGKQEGRQGLDRHHRDPVPGQQEAAAREDWRAAPREDRRRHLRSPRRVRSRGHADRRRAAPRRSAGGRAQQPLQAHPAADDVRHHHARDLRRPAEGAAAARHRRAVRRVPARDRAAPHRVRAAQGRGAGPHPRGPQDRARSPRRGHPADSRVEEPGRSARGPDGAVQAVAGPGAGNPGHAAAAADRARAPEDRRRAGRAAEDDRAAARASSRATPS